MIKLPETEWRTKCVEIWKGKIAEVFRVHTYVSGMVGERLTKVVHETKVP